MGIKILLLHSDFWNWSDCFTRERHFTLLEPQKHCVLPAFTAVLVMFLLPGDRHQRISEKCSNHKQMIGYWSFLSSAEGFIYAQNVIDWNACGKHNYLCHTQTNSLKVLCCESAAVHAGRPINKKEKEVWYHINSLQISLRGTGNTYTFPLVTPQKKESTVTWRHKKWDNRGNNIWCVDLAGMIN